MSEQTPNTQSQIVKIAGPLVVANGMASSKVREVVKVGTEKLIGEIIEIHGDEAFIQVYEETAGIKPGEPVQLTGDTLSVELGPGLLESIYDGIQRPLELIAEKSGHFIERGIDVPKLDRKKKWQFTPKVKAGDNVKEGDILGEVPETSLITHKVMVPIGISGKVTKIQKGDFTITDTIAEIGNEKIQMLQKWPIRKPRPTQSQNVPTEPLVTGMRILDTMFPLAKGGAASIPGPFGAGKSVTQVSVAKYCDAQIIVYIGCGERGNEMTDVLMEFPELEDPSTGEKLMKRTIIIANTSNMPIAAREASIYTGITLAEYYRDMGYHVALMADSTSRWAEALREMSGRLSEMPGEEGFPSYLGSRIAEFYERAGAVTCLGSDNRKGSLTVIGAVSPPGGDFSEPVTQNTLRVTKVFWGLDAGLAKKRHYPSINWLSSYSLYPGNVTKYWQENISPDLPISREKSLQILQDEAKLEEIVRLVGLEALSPKERLTMITAKMIREDFLQQNAFDEDDAFTPLPKQNAVLKLILTVSDTIAPFIEAEDFDFDDFDKQPFFAKIAALKTSSDAEIEKSMKTIPDQVRQFGEKFTTSHHSK